QVFNGAGGISDGDARAGLRPFVVGPFQLRQGNKDGIPLTRIPDGMSNTFMVVEANKPVPWTKPEDIPFDPARPLPPLGGRFPKSFHVVFADGAVRAVQTSTPEGTLKLYIQKDDGNVLPDLN